MSEVWYESAQPDEPVTQGALITDCLTFPFSRCFMRVDLPTPVTQSW